MDNNKKLLKDWYGFIGVPITEEELDGLAAEKKDEHGRVTDPLDDMLRSLVEMEEDFGDVVVDDFISYVRKRHTGPEERDYVDWMMDTVSDYMESPQPGRGFRGAY